MAISDIVKGAGERQLRELAEAGIRAKQALRGVRETACGLGRPQIRNRAGAGTPTLPSKARSTFSCWIQ